MKNKGKNKFMALVITLAMLFQCLPLTALASLENGTALVGQWTFDEGKGTTAADTSGNDNHGTMAGPTWTDGMVGKALSFSGNGCVEIPHHASLNPRNALTIEAWVNPSTNMNWRKVISKSVGSNTDYSIFQGAENNLAFSIKMGSIARTAYAPANSVPLGEWSYVVGTYDGCRMKLYLNGTLVKTINISGQINAHNEPLRIGGEKQGAYFEGKIDEVSIYNRALTAEEIASRYEEAINIDDNDDTNDTDNDEVPNYIEELFGTDKTKKDTDGDGLSDHIEIYITHTDPTIIDTDENGVSDAKEDLDGDRLTNIREIELGTALDEVDSDLDGLDDGDEILVYNTNPLLEDTDGDGLTDGDEIVLGLDPTKQKTDGVIPDSERTFTQQVSTDNISEALLTEENTAVPSLTVTAAGNVNKAVRITETKSVEFSDSRAIVGMPLDIEDVDLAEGDISFKLSEEISGFVSGFEYNTKIICHYDSDGNTIYLDTDYDEATNTITAPIDEEGTYFVVDVNALFNELGFALPSGSDMSAAREEEGIALMSFGDMAISETELSNGLSSNNDIPDEEVNSESSLSTLMKSNSPMTSVADSETIKVTSAPGAMGQADIVFIIDTTGSMYSAISNVKNNIGYFVDALNEMGVSAGLGLVEYRDIIDDGYHTTKVYKDGNSNWFYDIEKYKSVIGSLKANGGGDEPETAIDALETARLLDMRASAGKFFILVTDANYKIANRYDIPTMAYEIELLKNAGVCASVVTSDYYKNTYAPLYQETGGIWANMYGNFYTELMTLAYKIGEVVGDGYWIYLNGPVPVPIRLDEEPYEGSTVDTDGDGIYDVEELESIEPTGEVDLDEIIRIVSRGAITGTSYGVVKTYNCNSMPTTIDTDYDGIDDGLDMEPKNNTFKVVMEDDSYGIDANVSYTMDLRTFFGDNEKFNKNLCVTSSLFSAIVYEGITIEGKHADGLLEKHGFKDVDVYKLSERYSDEHLSEIAIGHKPVWYNDQKREIVSVIVRGTNGTIEEWSSNFDVGHTDEVGGDWVEWVNHKGFDIAATRILRYIAEYVEDNSLGTSSEIVFWVSGHSRGAAIANIIGARLGYKAFTYTFAAPNTTMDRLASLQKGIFNIVNSDDFVHYLPMEAWGFDKYGKTARISLGDNYEKEWEKLTGKRDYKRDAGMQGTINALAEVAEDRNDCYAYTCDCHGNGSRDDITASYWSQFSFNRDKAIEGIPANARKYCQITLYNPKLLGEHYGFEICQTPAYFMQLIADVSANDSLINKANFAIGYIISPRYKKAHKCVISSSGGLKHPHYLETYYLLSTHTSGAMFD